MIMFIGCNKDIAEILNFNFFIDLTCKNIEIQTC